MTGFDCSPLPNPHDSAASSFDSKAVAEGRPIWDPLEWACGSVVGTEHRRLGRNNQDSYQVLKTEDFLIALVCDGCGSSKHSEIGAKVGSRLLLQTIAMALQWGELDWEWVQSEVLRQIASLADLMGQNRGQMVQDYFLFTLVGCVITPSHSVLFALGDGVFILNHEVLTLEADNSPPYLGYGLLGLHYPIQVVRVIPTQALHSLLIGTDGVNDLLSKADHPLPGRHDRVGFISQFWQEDRYFQNPQMLQRHLNLINRDVTVPDWAARQLIRHSGLLPDDTTLIVLRQKKPG
ncbi:MAG: protein phosphatase 2C domain-containing protein [Cyanobacteriota bacterium]|nr:protein phosphatase 2C domain-containing protein [Cyanobacteriota bacterium]